MVVEDRVVDDGAEDSTADVVVCLIPLAIIGMGINGAVDVQLKG